MYLLRFISVRWYYIFIILWLFFLAYLNLPSTWKGNCFLVHWITNVTIFSRSVPLTVSDVNFLIWARRRRNSGPTEHMGQLGFLSPLDSNGGGGILCQQDMLVSFWFKNVPPVLYTEWLDFSRGPARAQETLETPLNA